jgi:phosphoglucomutase
VSATGNGNHEDAQVAYDYWCKKADISLKGDLADLADDPAAIEDAFFSNLTFGTGGLRGTIGAGTNRMNVHTVARATQGLANYLKANFDYPSVAVARDSRHMGWKFVQVTACVFAANGIHTWLYPRIEPTPALSFAVRYLHCSAGVCVTASHNPKEYNGYKVYGYDGCQITTSVAHDIQAAISAVDIFDDVDLSSWDEALSSGLVSWIGEDCIDDFLDNVVAQSLDMAPDTKLSIVYTPLNGTGQECVGRILNRIDNVDVTLVPEQSYPDGNFPTCPYPNPEIREALQCGLDLCKKVNSDLLVATDPDCDRVGLAVRHRGSYQLLTGNEVGILLADYIAHAKCSDGNDLSDDVVVTTIVSSDMVDALAKEYNFQVRRTLTGFKFIGEQIGLLEQAGKEGCFMLGFEESYGYLRGSYVRDKDAVVASMLICQMGRWHKSQGHDLVEAMEKLYEKYGFYRNKLISVEYSGEKGAYEMARIMSNLRNQPPKEIAGMTVKKIVDYLPGQSMPTVNPYPSNVVQQLPASDVLEFHLMGASKLIVRPSGTEPKIKAYLFTRADTADEADGLMNQLNKATQELLTSKGGNL